MANGTGELRGVVRGRTIELETETGLPDGSAVTVRLSGNRPELSDDEARDRLTRLAGAWAGDDDEGFEKFLKWNYEQRDRGSRPPIED
ncbi:MAG TPA: hypothetical protein VF170_05845 [Planctomycetaceae bacterium]